MGFRMVPKSVTLNDLEQHNGPVYLTPVCFAAMQQLWTGQVVHTSISIDLVLCKQTAIFCCREGVVESSWSLPPCA